MLVDLMRHHLFLAVKMIYNILYLGLELIKVVSENVFDMINVVYH